jgi:hypothetical protein
MALHDLLVSSYGLTSTRNVTSIESLAMFLWIVGRPQSFSQAENCFERSTWTIHMKFLSSTTGTNHYGLFRIAQFHS